MYADIHITELLNGRRRCQRHGMCEHGERYGGGHGKGWWFHGKDLEHLRPDNRERRRSG